MKERSDLNNVENPLRTTWDELGKEKVTSVKMRKNRPGIHENLAGL